MGVLSYFSFKQYVRTYLRVRCLAVPQMEIGNEWFRPFLFFKLITMKQKIISLFLFFFIITNIQGQSKYCKSYTDYMNDNWTSIDSLTITLRNNGQKVWSGGADFKPETGNKETDKMLKKESRFIIHNDTLYVNCKGLKYQGCAFGNWYAPGFRYEKDKICFICTKIGKKESMKMGMFGALGGAVGGAISASEQMKKRTCYIIHSDEKKVIRMTEKYMEELLAPHPEMLEEYNQMKKKEKEAADVIIGYLHRLQLLSKY